MAHVDFWYEFASTYSYLAAMRIERLADAAGVDVRWRPFLLGPIFKAQGWDSSPFIVYPAKGRYMWRDMERLCEAQGLAFVRPDPFPQNGLMAARIALFGLSQGWGIGFSKAVFAAEFGAGADISDPAVLAGCLDGLGLSLDVAEVFAAARAEDAKAALKAVTAKAQERGIFGAPTFITDDGELFWGNDRLEAALSWAARHDRDGTPGA